MNTYNSTIFLYRNYKVVENHRTPYKLDTAEIFATMVLETLMLNPTCSVFFWVFSDKNIA